MNTKQQKIFFPFNSLHNLVLIFVAGLSACVQVANPTLEIPSANDSQNNVLIQTSAPTETIVWFPATNTPTITPLPLPSATEVSISGIGENLTVDPFSETTKWTEIQESNPSPNRIILDEEGMVFALNEPPVRLSSLNTDLFLNDAFITITATINRCSTLDTYGVLFKAASEGIGNRLVLNCNGEIRLEQLRTNLVLPLLDWTKSGDVPYGAPGTVRIGIWTSGPEIRVFLNDHYQFTFFDSFYKTGSFGFFANSLDSAGLNIRFSEVEVHRVDYSSPTPTLAPSRTPLFRSSITPIP
jgi:hypothetical protein